MHWTDLLAVVPLIAMVYFILGLRGLFKRDLHIRACIALFILTGIIRSFIHSAAFSICINLLVVGIIVVTFHHHFFQKPPQR